MDQENLIAIVRNEFDRLQSIYSSNNRFRSERNLDFGDVPQFGEGWNPERVMQVVPLYVSQEQIIDRVFSPDYVRLPKELTDILNVGMLRTSGILTTDFSALMVSTVTRDGKPEGRTGTLLYKGKPILVEIDGKEFVVEVKGIGSPDGDNQKTQEMIREGYFGQSIKRYGSATESEGRREFRNLEIQRNENSRTFKAGDAVRGAALFIYKNDVAYGYESDRQDQAYEIRLSPSNVRASFNHNPDLPQLVDREMAIASSIGNHYAELANLRSTLLHSTIHPENFVRTAKGFVLTDLADCRKLEEIDKPYDFLSRVFDKIQEVPGITQEGVNRFYSTIAQGLSVTWDKSTGYKGFVDSIWAGFFAPKVYELRKGSDKRAQENIEAHRELVQMRIGHNKGVLAYLDIEGALNFLSEEVNLLKHIKAPEAIESVRIANERISYLQKQLKDTRDIKDKFAQNPENFYSLLMLPYMKK